MADGKWVMTDEDAKRIDFSFSGAGRQNLRELPNHGKHIAVDERGCKVDRKCAFCGSDDIHAGSGGFGNGFGYRSYKCKSCGGVSDFVYEDNIGKYFANNI